MKQRPAFVYIDDEEATVESFRKTVRKVWNLQHDVLSNVTFGPIGEADYDLFEEEICSVIDKDIERVECVFLDLDFSGNIESSEWNGEPDLVGLNIGREIRSRWPQLPIIIASRFTQKEILKKGLIFDFDNMYDGITLMQMSVGEFEGIRQLAKQKRQNLIEGLSDIPVSFRIGRNKYFRRWGDAPEKSKYAFVAMPFNTDIVRPDVWELGIKGALSELSIEAYRVDMDYGSVPVMEKIATLIFESAFVIVDITGWSANVLYETGLAHSANKETITICESEKVMELPFDIRHISTIAYTPSDLNKLKNDLVKSVRAILPTIKIG
ncbi:MAG: hypothetical protein ABW152_10585 [Candidatus Thiodiazotropha endolucinida]